jgi:predicted transglutaminase-like cysteine proteinase
MKVSAAITAMLLGLLPATPAAAAMAQPSFGKTLPPVGFVSFCGRNPAHCMPSAMTTATLRMTAARWRIVNRLNSLINAQIAPESDETLYGEAEFWTYPADAGDCEDYVLLKQRYLERLGFPRSALLITVVFDEASQGHAVLTLVTDEGDFILDNRSNQVRRWTDVNYSFLKRQSQHDPRDWVSLSITEPRASGAIASNSNKER